MIISLIPKCILEEEALVELKDLGVKFEETALLIGRCKVNCIRVYNLTENQVFDKLETKKLLEANDFGSDAERKSFASRNLAIIFMKIRQVANIQDKEVKCAAICSLLAAVNSLAAIDTRSASRFLPLIRGLQ